jgi:glycosyltransferase involved in cell wall biosynthesis
MYEKPEFSVIVPVFNSSATIKELIEGIRKVFTEIGRSFLRIVFCPWKIHHNNG